VTNRADSLPDDKRSLRRLLPGPVIGSILFATLVLNTVIMAVPLFLFVLVKLCMPGSRGKDRARSMAVRCAETWVRVNNLSLDLATPTVWDVHGLEGLSRDGSYLVNANHQAWADILVLQRVFSARIPFLMFFIKKELIWVPILGLAWKGLEFPFMKRYSRDLIGRRPELAGKDLETTRRMCARLRGRPVAIMNFLEGTRFTALKHARQKSPYKHLLRPKAGGIAFVMNAMGDQLDSMLDVTIAYPDGPPTLWEFLCGKVPRIVVRVSEREIPRGLIEGDYSRDPRARERAQAWVARVWAEKDRTLESLLASSSQETEAGPER
jgi:1-acyl-sn-glycerol-3-phosphate acyltransferase